MDVEKQNSAVVVTVEFRVR